MSFAAVALALVVSAGDASCAIGNAVPSEAIYVTQERDAADRLRCQDGDSISAFAREPARERCVALGNAAQTLHPVAGQGFNVGLRDAWELAEIVLDAPRERLGDEAMLRRYSRRRRIDRTAGIAFTHGLVRLFGNDLPLVRWPRGLALTLLDAVPAAKRAFTHAMLFGVR